jgi:hypothetical protein
MDGIMLFALPMFVIALLALGLGAFALITCRKVEINLRAFGLGFFLRSSK